MPTNPYHSMFMSKPGSVKYEYENELDPCDQFMGLPSVPPDPHFDWNKYYEST